MDIGRWLASLGLGQYTRAFEDNDIDEAVLTQLNDADLITLGVVSLGHRKRMLAGIAAMHGSATAHGDAIASGDKVANGDKVASAGGTAKIVEPCGAHPTHQDDKAGSAVDSPTLGHKAPSSSLAPPARTPSPDAEGPNASRDGERRQVTVLFADLSGFTALAQSLDAEEVRELVERFTRIVDRVVQSYGGTIDKHIGDAVMALFGAPLAHDTDPVRAARAALDIHAALAAQCAPDRAPMRAHIGIASGEVIAGTLDRGEARDYTVLGDSVNLAARLVDVAPPGQTLLADSVLHAMRSAFDHATGNTVACEPLGPMCFKGIETPVEVWRLSGWTSEEQSQARSRFVGRQGELEQFAGIAGACLRERTGHVVYVRGEPGIGKTRLVEEMRRAAQTRGFAFHRGLVLDFGSGKAQEPVRAVLESILSLTPSDTLEARAARIYDVMTEGHIAPELGVFLNDMLDVPQTGEWRTLYAALDNPARLAGKRNVIRSLVHSHCARTPALIVVEDLHWADAQTLSYLSAFATGVGETAGLLVMTSRVEGDPIDGAWRASCRRTPIATIDLAPLRREDALSLAGSYIDATQRIARDCVERAGGNPLFLEQLLRNAEEGHSESIPASIQSLVLARMDRLAPRDRTAFQAAAVIGQRFDLALLRELTGMPDYACTALVDNALVLPDDEHYLFAHALIQEAAYSTLLRAPRRALHRRSADWFAGSDPVLRAQHLDRANDADAPGAYLDAAQSLRRRYAPDSALRMTARGIEIASNAAQRHDLMMLHGELERDLGDVAASIDTYRASLATAPDELAQCRSQIGLADGLRVTEGLVEARALLDSAQRISEHHAMHAELAHLHHLRGNLLFPLGDVDGCDREHQQGLDYAKRVGSAEAEARALGGLGDAAYAQGRMRTAFGYFSRCVALSHEHGFGRIEVANHPMVGFCRIYLNEVRQARLEGEAAVRTASMVGQPRAEMVGETIGVFSSYELGDVQAARAHLDRERHLIRQLGAKRFEAQSIEMGARLLIDEGKKEEAVEQLMQSLSICREVGMQFSAPKTLGALSLATDNAGQRHAALIEAETLLERGAVAHNHFWFYRDAIEAMLEAHDANEALRYVAKLEASGRRETLPWIELFAARGRVLANVIERCVQPPTRAELNGVRVSLAEAGFSRFLKRIDCAIEQMDAA